MRPNARDFLHPKLNEQVTSVGGSYFLFKEVRLPFDDGDLLYLIGAAIFDTSCCGAGGCAYALVPGFVRKWKYRLNADDRPVSEVSSVVDERLRGRIKTFISQKESVYQVDFI